MVFVSISVVFTIPIIGLPQRPGAPRWERRWETDGAACQRRWTPSWVRRRFRGFRRFGVKPIFIAWVLLKSRESQITNQYKYKIDMRICMMFEGFHVFSYIFNRSMLCFCYKSMILRRDGWTTMLNPQTTVDSVDKSCIQQDFFIPCVPGGLDHQLWSDFCRSSWTCTVTEGYWQEPDT